MKTRNASRLSSGTGQLPVLPQAAALCYRFHKGRPEVLLITSRRARRWIIPKGWPIDGLSASETARQEAWEEAGVVGTCAPDRLDQFSVVKKCPMRGRVLCAVDVFPLYVTTLEPDYPERAERQRIWVSSRKAVAKVASSELAAVLRRFAPRIQ